MAIFKLAGLPGVLVAALIFCVPAEAQLKKQPSEVAGSWRGKYVCAQGVTALNLSILDMPGGKLEATFSFGPLPSNPTVPRGAYRMDGTYNAETGAIDLVARGWDRQPDGYVMVDLGGHLSPLGLYIAGEIDGPGCGPFELVRADDLLG